MQKYDNIKTKSSTCPVCGQRTELKKSDIYWCDNLEGAAVSEVSVECCSGSSGRRITTVDETGFPGGKAAFRDYDQIRSPGTYDEGCLFGTAPGTDISLMVITS